MQELTKTYKISIHALREEGDIRSTAWHLRECDFYPRPPRGGRPVCLLPIGQIRVFLSTPSARRATRSCPATIARGCNFYPRPPRGGRQRLSAFFISSVRFLSTPSARRATDYRLVRLAKFDISIHALREEGDRCPLSIVSIQGLFLSTPSARRATLKPILDGLSPQNFYPRPPRGGRQQKQRQNLYFQTNYTTFCTNLEEL